MQVYIDIRIKQHLLSLSAEVSNLLEGMAVARAWCSGFAALSPIEPVLDQITTRKARNRKYVDIHNTHELQSLFMPKEGKEHGTDTD